MLRRAKICKQCSQLLWLITTWSDSTARCVGTVEREAWPIKISSAHSLWTLGKLGVFASRMKKYNEVLPEPHSTQYVLWFPQVDLSLEPSMMWWCMLTHAGLPTAFGRWQLLLLPSSQFVSKFIATPPWRSVMPTQLFFKVLLMRCQLWKYTCVENLQIDLISGVSFFIQNVAPMQNVIQQTWLMLDLCTVVNVGDVWKAAAVLGTRSWCWA